MALIECKFYSEVLGLSTSMTVLLPQAVKDKPGCWHHASGNGRHKTLYLLHGLGDDHSAWLRQTSIERYAAPLGIAVVMPEVHRSFYSDMACGGEYERFTADELPRIARSFFPLSDAREDNYIAGLSMGGYGAFKLAFNYPDHYCAAASLSGALDMASRFEDSDNPHQQDAKNIFGDLPCLRDTKHDLFFTAKELLQSGRPVPNLYQCCGTADFLYEDNLRFRDFAQQEQLPLLWQEDAGYAHTWDYWDLGIQSVLAWMFQEES
ncbi:esterase [candidate division KSB3 bacterium]|uniref:Esterase n=1 Tax=candidate division KSB3 bacterium TaxID=2044937 RepID=A0A2G6E6L0_9BACT|nr:MAG: esterase [candidate division KSB3 bacterium]PIE30139.1 MAG: esterase [candidate division KSB3 bacterium]